LQQFRIEELLKTQSPETIAAGTMDFSMDLALQGKTAQEMKQSASGEVTLRGENLTLSGHDLDREFSRFESSQNFSLVDLGAYFFAGPVGLAVTKGYDFANLLKGSGGVSPIHTFVSQWKVENGVMHAQDVAMATDKYRMAFLGGLDIANARFVDVTLALVDDKGCAEVAQKIKGPFVKPVVEQPNIFTSIAGPAIKLLKEGRKLLPGGECNVIYTGTVASPQ
jgi:AsmA-like C-terminal region